MRIRQLALVGLLVVVALSACGSDDSDVGGAGTELEVELVVTSGAGIAPPADGSSPPIASPDDATTGTISGTVRCAGEQSTGTGMFSTNAVQACLEITVNRSVFDELAATSDDVVCGEIYGGPQRASIEGSIDGKPVDIEIDRTNSCGIANWTRLEWFLGPPTR